MDSVLALISIFLIATAIIKRSEKVLSLLFMIFGFLFFVAYFIVLTKQYERF